MSVQSRKLAWSVVVLVFVICAEVASAIAGAVFKTRGIFYTPPADTSLRRYLAARDPDLGWPSPNALGHGDTDSAGSRVVPTFPDPTTPTCASIYGDSFAWAE